MFGGNKFGGGYNVSGTSENVSDAIKEQELTNREGIKSEKEVKIEEWRVNMAKATAERETHLAQVKKDLDVKLASIKAESDVNMKKTTAGLNSDQNFNIQSQELQNAAQENHDKTIVMQQKIGLTQEFKMKELDCKMKALELQYNERSEKLQSNHQITMGAMNSDHEQTKLAMQYKGNLAMTALKKGGRSFRLSGNALDFGDTRGMTRKIGGLTQGFQQNQIGFDTGKMHKHSRNEAIALPGPSEAFVDSDGEDESINDSSLFDMDLNMEMEEMKFEGELKKEEMKLERMKMDKELEMEKLKLEQKKNDIELARLALLAKEV